LKYVNGDGEYYGDYAEQDVNEEGFFRVRLEFTPAM
jgi:hypothetical protein